MPHFPTAHLSTQDADPLGHVLIQLLPSTRRPDIARRVNRVQTLDGGVAFNDFGLAYADRVWELRFRPTRLLLAQVERLLRTAGELVLSIEGEVALVVPESLSHGTAEATLRLLAKADRLRAGALQEPQEIDLSTFYVVDLFNGAGTLASRGAGEVGGLWRPAVFGQQDDEKVTVSSGQAFRDPLLLPLDGLSAAEILSTRSVPIYSPFELRPFYLEADFRFSGSEVYWGAVLALHDHQKTGPSDPVVDVRADLYVEDLGFVSVYASSGASGDGGINVAPMVDGGLLRLRIEVSGTHESAVLKLNGVTVATLATLHASFQTSPFRYVYLYLPKTPDGATGRVVCDRVVCGPIGQDLPGDL